MASKLVILLAVASCLAAVQAYSKGAPVDVCEDMTPKHPVPPQKTRMPYSVRVNKDKVRSGETVKITLNGQDSFKGFLVQVRQGGKNLPIGKFVVDAKDKHVHTIGCGQGQQVMLERFRQIITLLVPGLNRFFPPMLQNAATHKNSDDKNNLSIDWQVPPNVKGQAQV